jgi:muramoyltetrapeptide carboxypeptidase
VVNPSKSNSLPLIKPPRLRPGDQVRVIAPAGPVKREDLEAGMRRLQSSGLEVSVGSGVYRKHGYLAGEDEVRLEDLHAAFRDSQIRAVFCARGGYGTLRLLDKIHYDSIRQNPKILVGYSDITGLMLAIYKKTGLLTFHGPMVSGLTLDEGQNWSSLFRLLSSKTASQLGLTNCTVINPGKARGPLIGGNLSLICHLLGTPFFPELKGAILLIEERGEPLYRLDRMLTHVSLAGHLKGLSGLIAGDFDGCGNTSAIINLFTETFSRLNIPVVSGLHFGHGKTNLALPLGAMAEIDTERMSLSIMEPCVDARMGQHDG